MSQRLQASTVSLAGVLLLFVASRLLYLVLINPSYLFSNRVEELYRGAIAQELVTGLKIPFTEYRADNYSGGSLVIGLVASVFFRLFGPTAFALKLTPLLFFTAALLFWSLTVHRHISAKAATYFALLFICSPPLFTAFSVTAMGYHSESIFFSALTVFLLFSMLSQEKPSLAFPAILGLTAGFGLWFAYIYGLTLLVTLGFWLWHGKGKLWWQHVLWFALGFIVGFSPWIIINVQNDFSGLVVRGRNVWEYFGLEYLWDGLSDPRRLAPVAFLATIGTDDPWDLYRRAVNLLYSLLYLGPILAAGVLRLKAIRSEPAAPRLTRPRLAAFGVLYLILFTLAIQLSDFRDAHYNVPAYPFLFFLVAYSLVRCQDIFPGVQRHIQTVFLVSAVLFALGTHAPLLSPDRPGYALSAKGYSYAFLPESYLDTHAPAGSGNREFLLKVVQRLFLSDFLPELSSEDQRELSRPIALLLANATPLNGQAEEFSQIERLVPPGFDKHFYYQLGAAAMERYPNELPKAVEALNFLRHRSAAAYHLALVGIYWQWPQVGTLDRTPESMVKAPADVAPELSSHYWRALGQLAVQYWCGTDRSMGQFQIHLQSFVSRVDPSVQRYVLQGVGERLFYRLFDVSWIRPAELERFPQAYQEGLLEGWGTALGKFDLLWGFPWRGHESPYWTAWTKGLSARGLVFVQQGIAQFEALFEGPASCALEPPR